MISFIGFLGWAITIIWYTVAFLFIVGGLMCVRNPKGSYDGSGVIGSGVIMIGVSLTYNFFFPPESPKVAAFRNVAYLYSKQPDPLSGEKVLRDFNNQIEKAQSDYLSIRFDVSKNRNDAMSIVKLYRRHIDKRFQGGIYFQLEEEIIKMIYELEK